MRNIGDIFIFAVWVCLFSGMPSLAAKDQYNLRQITPRDGMLSNIRCIHAEKRGFVWMGSSSEGLVRFDNYLPHRYSSQDKGEHVLPGDNIYQITEDSLGHIWVLTDKGLARYRPATDDFFIPQQYWNGGGGNLIVHCALPTAGGMLFGSQNQIFQYNYDSDSIKMSLTFHTEHPYPIHAVYPLDDGRLLCFNRWYGLLLLDPRTGETRPPSFDCKRENTSILVDSRNRVWLSPYNQGIECFDTEGRRIAVYNTRNSTLSNDIVLCMTEHDGEIWIGTDGGGINILDPERGTISSLDQVSGNLHSMPWNSIRTLYSDHNGTIWAGRVRGGIVIIRRSPMKMYVGTSPKRPDGLSNGSVLCLCRDWDTENIWIGTDGGGIDKFDPRTSRFTHFLETFGYKIVSIAHLSHEELLLSVFSRGLFTFDKHTGKMHPLDCEDPTLQYRMSYSGQTVNLLEESPQTLLILSKPLYRYYTKSGRMEKLATPDCLNGVLPIASGNGASYFHDQKHIYRLNLLSNQVETVFEIGSDSSLNSVAQAEDGAFWIASGKGICRYSPQTEDIEDISIPFLSRVKSVLCDTRGKIWIGSDNGVFAWLHDGRRFIPLGESDGVLWNEFRPKARLATPDGSVYLGGSEGLLHINGERSTTLVTDEPVVELMDVVLDDMRIETPPCDNTLCIPWSNNSLTVRIRVLEDDILRKRLYRFRINGNDYQEEIDSRSPELTLRQLVPGSYTLAAKCNTPDGQWTPWKQLLTYTVTPLWYKTRWFKALWITAIAMAISGIFLAFFRHKRQLLQLELERYKQRITEDKVRFLINISHELRTPLTLILGPLGRLVKNGEENDTRHSVMRKIYKQALRMKNLINMVLTLRKMETGMTALHPQMQDLNQWVRELVEDFSLEANERGIEICIEEDALCGERCFDSEKCTSVLSNLLINALKHSPDHSQIVVRTEYAIQRNRIRISVSDRGDGLNQVDTTRLFTRFYQGDKERSGSGIGLSYARILVEQHGGTIGASENIGGGAIFYFELPATLSERQIVCSPRNYLNELLASESLEEFSDAESDLTQRSVLIVEDEEELGRFLNEELKDKTHQLYVAKDGIDALGILKQKSVDVIVSDIMMPRMDGYELCRQVKSNIAISHIPIILLTARNDEHSQLLGYKNGADGYMTKPFETEMLIAAVASILRNRELIRGGYRQRIMPAPEDTTFSSADELFLIKLKKIICDNLQQSQFNIPFLCREIGMSRTVLYNKLKLLTGLNIKEYVTRVRIEQACKLIKESQFSITEIAEQTGFSSSRYFSTAFKQYMGVTPSQYKVSVTHE